MPVALIGTGKRSGYMYGPLVKAMKDDLRLVSVWGRSEDSARALGELLEVPWYTDMDRLARDTHPAIGIVSLQKNANGSVGIMALQRGMNVLVETPIAVDLGEADTMIRVAREAGLKIEVAEQFHRRPLEQIKLMLLRSGLFGRVYSSFNDFAGHGYHGISVMRSYLGFDAKPVRVVGAVRDYPLVPHYSKTQNTRGARTETQIHGMVHFEGDRLGIFHWTSVGYDSALRWWRSSRFLAEKGMGMSVGVGLDVEEKLTLLAPGGEAPLFVTIQREWERCDGGALRAIHAYTADAKAPIVSWENRFCTRRNGWNPQWHDDEIGIAGCIMSLVDAVRQGGDPSYGPEQGRLDQELILAIERSSSRNGAPVDLPLA